jgi:hypothetical protein
MSKDVATCPLCGSDLQKINDITYECYECKIIVTLEIDTSNMEDEPDYIKGVDYYD